MIAAVIQMNSQTQREENWAQAEALLRSAAAQGANLAVLPENFPYMAPEGQPPAFAESLKGPTMAFLSQTARELDLWIVGGSFAQKIPGSPRVYNTCPVLDNQGQPQAFYHKIHLFDLAMPGQAALKESARVRPGRQAVVVQTPWGALGLSICYDLRFPELYRRLRLKGASILAAPSAFTRHTGEAHWELLCRTRAVENQCYLLAAAQWGSHAPGRESFGQAMIVDPWGEILAQCGPGPGVALAQVEPQRVHHVRRLLDSTSHARLLPRAWSGN